MGPAKVIDLTELHIEIWPPHEKGGQHVTRTISGVKITHIPTGTVAIVECGISQHKSMLIAMNMILCALTDPDFV